MSLILTYRSLEPYLNKKDTFSEHCHPPQQDICRGMGWTNSSWHPLRVRGRAVFAF